MPKEKKPEQKKKLSSAKATADKKASEDKETKVKKTPQAILKREAERVRTQALEKIITLLTGGFGLVAALAWNDAIKKLFAELFGADRSSVIAQFGYAILVTLIVVILSINLSRLTKKKEKDKDNKK